MSSASISPPSPPPIWILVTLQSESFIEHILPILISLYHKYPIRQHPLLNVTMFPSLYTWSSLERDMASDLHDYHESPDLNIVYEPGKPSLKNVSLPASSPASGPRMISTSLLSHHDEASTSSSPYSKRYSSNTSADTQKTRSSVPLKGILKKSQRGVSSRPSTPAPFAKGIFTCRIQRRLCRRSLDHVNTESVTTQSTPEGKYVETNFVHDLILIL